MIGIVCNIRRVGSVKHNVFEMGGMTPSDRLIVGNRPVPYPASRLILLNPRLCFVRGITGVAVKMKIEAGRVALLKEGRSKGGRSI
jgi:hypothetical protein